MRDQSRRGSPSRRFVAISRGLGFGERSQRSTAFSGTMCSNDGCLDLNAQYGIGRQRLCCPWLFSKCGHRSGSGFVKGGTLDRHRVDRPVHRLHCYPAGPRRRHDVSQDSIVFAFYSP